MIRVIDSLYNDIEPKYWIKEYQHVQRIFNLFCNVTVWTFWNNNKNQVHGYLQNFRIKMKEWVSSLMITYSLYLNWHWCDRFVPNQSQTRLVNKNLILAKHMLGCKRKTNMLYLWGLCNELKKGKPWLKILLYEKTHI